MPTASKEEREAAIAAAHLADPTLIWDSSDAVACLDCGAVYGLDAVGPVWLRSCRYCTDCAAKRRSSRGEQPLRPGERDPRKAGHPMDDGTRNMDEAAREKHEELERQKQQRKRAVAHLATLCYVVSSASPNPISPHQAYQRAEGFIAEALKRDPESDLEVGL